MKLKVERFSTGKLDTISHFFIDDKPYGFILEDTFHKVKIFGETRVPEGVYQVKLRNEGDKNEKYKLRFGDFHKGMLWITNIPNFEYVYIHIGNTYKDTEGCLLVGDNFINKLNQNQRVLLESEKQYKIIYPIISHSLLSNQEVEIKIIDVEK